MPTGTTSYFSGSSAAITLPAEMQEIECSLERPPKTTATRGFEGRFTRPTLPAHRPVKYAGDMRPATQAVHLGRPPHEPDEPFNTPITMASTYVAGGDREYGRYTNPTWTAFEDALGGLEGGRCLAFASGLAAVSTILDLVANGEKVVAPRHSYNGSLVQLNDLELRERVTPSLRRHHRSRCCRRCLRGRLPGLDRVPDQPGDGGRRRARDHAAAHEAGAYVVFDNTFATPILQQPLEWGVDLVVHSATKYISGHSDVLMGAVVTRDDQLYDVLKGRRDLFGAIPGTFEAWLALRGLRTLPLRVERAQANAQELVRRLRERTDVTEVRYPGFGGMIALVLPHGGAADLVQHSTELWVYATSLGGVESTLERRRRWKGEPTTIPEGLIRLSVGIEDVEDLWEDLSRALDAAAG